MTTTTSDYRTKRRNESGQVMLFVVIGLGIFLIGAMAFAIDLSNMWFTRQSAQTTADAVCTAAAMDMLVGATDGSMPANAKFTPSASNTYDCHNANPPAPCSYGTLNGASSTISRTAAVSGTLGNNVYMDFPSPSSVGLSTLNLPSSSTPVLGSAALVRVQVASNISTWFAGMLKGMRKQQTGAKAICGVIQATSPIPILVLNPTVSGALSMNGGGNLKGTGDIQIDGGPSKSIQVNSSSTTAVSSKGNPVINLCAGGSNYCGSTMGVWGTESATGGFWNTVSQCNKVNTLCTASQTPPQWNSPSAPIADPLATVTAPSQPTNVPGAPTAILAGQTTNGCVDPNGCYEYAPGYYPSGICIGKGGCTYKTYTTAIFDPGIYYIIGGLSASSNSCLRPSTATGDGSGGTMFYFADTNSISVNANSGCSGTAFNVTTGTGSLANGVKCTSTSQIPSNLAAQGTLSGSVLLAPCKTPTVNTLCAPNCSLNFGDPLGTSDPIGEQRGILFFQNRAKNAGTNPSWGGNGSMLLAGTMYFHQCVTSGSDTGVGCNASTAYNDTFSLGGTPSSSTYVLGDVIADKLSLSGNAGLTMDLNPSAAYTTLKAALVQ